MGKKLDPKHLELYKRTDEVLYYIWDPIGVSLIPTARDEYQSYLTKIFYMLLKTENGDEIISELECIATEHMGLPKISDKAKIAVSILIGYKEQIFDEKAK